MPITAVAISANSVVNPGPSLGRDFHIVGEIFDAVQPDGVLPALRDTASTWYVPAGGGAVFEVTFDQAGTYSFLYLFVSLAVSFFVLIIIYLPAFFLF